VTALKLTEGMAEELKQVIYKYHGSMPLATAIGVLEIVKAELMQDHKNESNDDDET
jgi:predicted outer membrane lipoprotein